MIERDGDVVWFTPHAGVPLTVDGHPLRGRVRVFSDADLAPTTIGFDGGKGWLMLIRRGDRLALPGSGTRMHRHGCTLLGWSIGRLIQSGGFQRAICPIRLALRYPFLQHCWDDCQCA